MFCHARRTCRVRADASFSGGFSGTAPASPDRRPNRWRGRPARARILTAATLAALLALGALPPFPGSPCHAAQVTMKAEPDRREMTVDDTLTLYVTLSFSERNVTTGNLEFPKNPDFESQGASYQEQIMIVNGALSVRKTIVFSLIPLRAGNLTVPPLRNYYIDPASGARVELETAPVGIAVKAVAPPPERRREDPVAPAIPVGSPLSGTAAVVLTTIAVIAAVSFVIARLLRRADGPAPAPLFDLAGGVSSPDPAAEVAAALRRTAAPAPPAEDARAAARRRAGEMSRERLSLLAREDERAFARELARLVKDSLEASSGRPFAGKTSDEILGEIAYLRLGGEARERVESLLSYTDEISYCGGAGPPERRERAIDELRRLHELLKNDERR